MRIGRIAVEQVGSRIVHVMEADAVDSASGQIVGDVRRVLFVGKAGVRRKVDPPDAKPFAVSFYEMPVFDMHESVFPGGRVQ